MIAKLPAFYGHAPTPAMLAALLGCVICVLGYVAYFLGEVWRLWREYRRIRGLARSYREHLVRTGG